MFSVKPVVQDYWDWRAAGNFIFGGTGSGLIFALPFAMSFAALGGSALAWPLLIGMAFVGAGLFLVWLEIGKPWRFLNVFRNPFTSWMSREAYAAVVLMAAAFAAAAAAYLGAPIPALVWLSAILGLVFLHCQARILHASRGIPAWRDPFVQPVIWLTGLTEGLSVLALVLVVAHGVPAWLLWALVAALLARAIAYRSYRLRMSDGRAPTAVVNRLNQINAKVWGVAVVAPVIFAGIALATANGAPVLAAASTILAAICSIFGGWYTKYNIVRKLAHVQGLAVKHMPVRGTGRSGKTAQPGWSAPPQ